MSDQVKFEVYKASRTSQDKYTYFQLTASGAAIALAINQTHESSIQWSQLPLAFAVIVWGLSFFFGCRQLTYVNAALNLNMELLNVQKGSHSVVGGHPERIQVASEAIKELIEKDGERSAYYARWQFRSLTVGAVFYILWHVLEVYFRT